MLRVSKSGELINCDFEKEENLGVGKFGGKGLACCEDDN